MFDPISWAPSPAFPLLFVIGSSSRSTTSAPEGQSGTEIFWRDQPSRCLRTIRFDTDAHVAHTVVRVGLVKAESRGQHIPDGLVEAMLALGFIVDVHDADAPTEDGFVDDEGKVRLSIVDRAVDAFVSATGHYPSRVLASPDVFAAIADSPFAKNEVVVVEGTPAGWCYVERAGHLRAGEPVRLVVDDNGVRLEASAPHPFAPWRFIRGTTNDAGLPNGEYPARLVDGAVGALVDGANVDVPGFASVLP